MTTERWQRIGELFQRALTYSPDQRESVIAEACGDDDELRHEVVTLLKHDERASPEFMRPPDGDNLVRTSSSGEEPDPLIGKRVSGYQIKRVIAGGGMGTVYEAEQDNPKRSVAIKVLHAGVTSRYAQRHFEHESRILAHLRHPNIAQVYEAGTLRDSARGNVVVPYFAMEYIPGAHPITHYADLRQFGIRERLKLFMQVCEAVHHGHQKGIIHRDLKPGNILVDSTGCVKVIDFGVARSTDSDMAVTTIQTEAGQLIGTLQYMSPEQCAADPLELDTRSDVYALGVILYELLCRRLPYELTNMTIQSTARAICEQSPVPLSTINRKLRGDLEIITLKALEKDREKRFQSAIALADDIRRFVDGEPIMAKPQTVWTRTLRWVGQHPFATTAIGCTTLVVLVAALTYLSLLWVNFQPYKVELGDSYREARLVARSGSILHNWTGENPGSVPCGALVWKPAEYGGGALAVIGFGASFSGPWAGMLCAFDARRSVEEPGWTASVETSDIPAMDRSEFVGRDFHPAGQLLVADIFPEVPGPEIVVVFAHAYSRRSIRIYDVTGTLQYEFWHRGGMRKVYWIRGARTLVCCGDTSLVERNPDPEGGKDRCNPLVLFALRPTRGRRLPEYINPEYNSKAPDVVWYQYLAPIDANDTLELRGLQPPSSARTSSDLHVELVLKSRTDDRAGISWTIDPNGNEVPGTRILSDRYVLQQDTLPEPKTLRLTSTPLIGDDID